MIQWQRSNLLTQIKINLSWKKVHRLLIWHTNICCWGRGMRVTVWGENSNTDWPLVANVTYLPLHYLLARKKCHYVLHMEDQTLLLSARCCVPIVISPDPKEVLAAARPRTLLFIFYQSLPCFSLSPTFIESNARCQSAALPFPSRSAPRAIHLHRCNTGSTVLGCLVPCKLLSTCVRLL